MDRTLRKILIKIQSIQVGILRFITPDDEKLLFRARAGAYDGELNCVLERAGNTSLLSQSVNLIQKDKEDYLYITCKVRDEVVNSSAVIVSMEILKACWFIRRARGNVSWLQEKYVYHSEEQEMELVS